MANEWLIDLRERRLPASIGKKAANLRLLEQAGFHVPPTLVCRWEAHQYYLDDRVELVAELKKELERKLRPGTLYAVRSSANLEDGGVHTFAGQFKSQLNVSGVDAVLQSVWNTWAMTRADRVQAYQQKHGLGANQLKMAVLVQEMVPPIVSGVAFSRNPVNGAAEVVVEAVPGSGEALVQTGQTPYRWVWKGGNWQTVPDGGPIDTSLVAEVVKGTQAIAKRFRKDVDLEWVYDGSQVNWVQMREITSLAEVKIYSRRIARDMLPGMIHPLVWSVNTPLVNGAWIGLLTELIGPNDLKPEQLARSFYYRTYFEMGAFRRIFESFGFPPESLEMMMGVTNEPRKMPAFKMSGYTLRLLPRMLRFIGSKISFAKRVNQLLPVFQEQADGFAYQDLSQLDEAALLAQVDRLAELVHRVAYYNINTPLLMAIYNMVLRRQLRSNGIDFERLDVVKGLDELKQYQPAIELEALHRAFLTLPETARQMLQLQHSAALAGLEGGEGEAFRTRFYAFTGRFGHLSDSGNDFSVQPWREQPDLLLEMIINYRRASGSEAEKLGYADLQLPGWKKWMISGIYNRARQFRFLRERVGSLYTFAYGQFRRYFLELEQRLVRRGVLHTAGDIFMLNLDEVRRVVSGSLDGAQAVALAAARREEMHLCRDISLPEEIYGDDVKPLNMTVSRCLTGIPTSRGLYTGPVSVVNGIRDFGKVEPGAVLVVPFTDVGWTPLFARAGAVISESGGLLSHSSIIAREFSIPAVVSVENATTLPDHTVVTVDGYKGEITVH